MAYAVVCMQHVKEVAQINKEKPGYTGIIFGPHSYFECKAKVDEFSSNSHYCMGPHVIMELVSE